MNDLNAKVMSKYGYIVNFENDVSWESLYDFSTIGHNYSEEPHESKDPRKSVKVIKPNPNMKFGHFVTKVTEHHVKLLYNGVTIHKMRYRDCNISLH